MQMKHRKFIKILLVLALTVGALDIYIIHSFAIPYLFLNESGAPSVPVQKERPPKIVPKAEAHQPVPITIPAGNPLSGKTPNNKTADGEAGASTPEEVKTLDPQNSLDKPAESVVSGSDVGNQKPESQPTRDALPKATTKQLLVIEPLRFGPNRILLWKFEKKALKEVAKQLLHYNNIAVRLVGHADDQERNPDELSMARALKAKAFLEAEGVPTELIEVESVGAKKPATKRTSAEDRKKNRRVRVRLFIKDTM